MAYETKASFCSRHKYILLSAKSCSSQLCIQLRVCVNEYNDACNKTVRYHPHLHDCLHSWPHKRHSGSSQLARYTIGYIVHTLQSLIESLNTFSGAWYLTVWTSDSQEQKEIRQEILRIVLRYL